MFSIESISNLPILKRGKRGAGGLGVGVRI